MNYTDTFNEITKKYGVELVGWTHPVFANPSLLGSNIPLLEKLVDALETGKCKFVRLTSEELAEKGIQRDRAIDAGEIVPKTRKRRSDAGKKRAPRTTTSGMSPAVVDDSEDDIDDDLPPPQKRQNTGLTETQASGSTTTASAQQHPPTVPRAPAFTPPVSNTWPFPTASSFATPAHAPPPSTDNQGNMFNTPMFGFPPFPGPSHAPADPFMLASAAGFPYNTGTFGMAPLLPSNPAFTGIPGAVFDTSAPVNNMFNMGAGLFSSTTAVPSAQISGTPDTPANQPLVPNTRTPANTPLASGSNGAALRVGRKKVTESENVATQATTTKTPSGMQPYVTRTNRVSRPTAKAREAQADGVLGGSRLVNGTQ